MARVFGECAAIDELRTGFCKWTFAKRGKILVQLTSENELENRVAKEFEPLVGLNGDPLLVSD